MGFGAIGEKERVEFGEIAELRLRSAGIGGRGKKVLNFARGGHVGKNFAEGLGIAPGVAEGGVAVEDGAKFGGIGGRARVGGG